MYTTVILIVLMLIVLCGGFLIYKSYRIRRNYEQFRHDLYYVSDEERVKREAIQEEFSNIR